MEGIRLRVTSPAMDYCGALPRSYSPWAPRPLLWLQGGRPYLLKGVDGGFAKAHDQPLAGHPGFPP